jgi:hypothetical protein
MKAQQENAYYKYRPLYQYGASGREAHPFTRSILTDGKIFYAAPKDFNDPFDCNLKVHVRDSTDTEWEAYCDALTKKYGAATADMAKLKAGKLWRVNPLLSDSIGNETLRINYEESSVFCLSKKPNSIPMFSYYADSHKGIAVEFQFSDVEIPCGIARDDLNHQGVPYGGKIILGDVKYPTSYPELNYHRLYDTPALLENLLFTKHHEWRHEEEVRIFRRGVPAGAVEFDKKSVSRVIFGCNTTADDVEMVRCWLANRATDVALAKAERATDRFDLVVTDFDTVKAPV